MGKQEKETKKKKQQVDYEIIYFWDIETSKVYADGQEEPIQVVFLSNVIEFNMVTGKVTNSVFHRTLDEFITYLSIISNEYREFAYQILNMLCDFKEEIYSVSFEECCLVLMSLNILLDYEENDDCKNLLIDLRQRFLV